MPEIAHRLRTALSLLQPSALALRPYRCPLCGPGLLLRLSRDGIGVRCMRCGASAITQSLVAVLRLVRPDFEGRRVYELSSRGALFEFLRREVADFTCSEYFDDVPPGDRQGGVLCQDVQRLTFGDGSFDICTSTEVFEHVPDDRRGFAEIRRVLAPGGAFMFTVPLSDSPRTVERAVLAEGGVRHILPPTYHHDRIRGREQVLVYRDYGQDITQRLLEAGFARAYIDRRFERAWLGAGCGVIVAEA